MIQVAQGTASRLAWLDHDEEASARLREVLRAFEEKSTLDNLGLGLIRDTFSDLLFPGTSTIQTRARYFLFVPWICRQLETEHVSATDFDRRLRQREVELVESLRTGVDGEGEGVVGYQSRERTQRLPSSIYWRGLARLGIRLNDFSLPEYRVRLPDLYRSQQASQRDDDGHRLRPLARNWDPSLPEPPGRFPREPITFEMTRDEADYLADRIRLSTSGSLFAVLVDAPELLVNADTPWSVDQAVLPAGVRTLITHAHQFSDLMWGAQLLYNLMLVERARLWLDRDYADLEASVRSMLAGWVEDLEARRPEIENWANDLASFWGAVGRPVPLPARMFIERWIATALANPARVADDQALRNDVEHRERVLKGRLARLSNRAALEDWTGQPLGIDPLTYRWGQSTRILRDIHAGRA